jgi:putative transcriptional regulator
MAMVTDTTFLTDRLLIAMPALADPNFHQTVTYVCEHNAEGAMGIVVNRPLEIDLGEVLSHMSIASDDPAVNTQPVFAGGPVQRERGFVLHHPVGEWESTLAITDTLAITTSRDILVALAGGQGPRYSLVALGYAGWGAGQLEQEMADNAWLSGPASLELLFHTPVQDRWRAAAAAMGVDINLLSAEAGHA